MAVKALAATWLAKTVQFVRSDSYDCKLGLDDWKEEWSENQQTWCCATHGLGCSDSDVDLLGVSFDCDEDYDFWQVSWSTTKQAWCCEHKQRGCEDDVTTDDADESTEPTTVTTTPFVDCQDGLINPNLFWNDEKIAYCCSSQGLGCPANAFDCESGYINWVHQWSEGKKIWCCHTSRRGCPPTTFTSTSTATETTTITQKPCDHLCELSGMSVSCRERIHFASMHTFLGLPNACEYAHGLVMNECQSVCNKCDVLDACYGAADIAITTEKTTHPPTTTVTREPAPFDCQEGLERWQDSWFPAKQNWCCTNEKLGCWTTSTTFISSTVTTVTATTITATTTSTRTLTTTEQPTEPPESEVHGEKASAKESEPSDDSEILAAIDGKTEAKFSLGQRLFSGDHPTLFRTSVIFAFIALSGLSLLGYIATRRRPSQIATLLINRGTDDSESEELVQVLL
jgi:hypothetical protein